MKPVGRAERHAKSYRYCLAAVLICAGLVVAPVHGVAWADGTESGSPSTSSGPSSSSGSAPTDAKAPDSTTGKPDASNEQVPSGPPELKAPEPEKPGLEKPGAEDDHPDVPVDDSDTEQLEPDQPDVVIDEPEAAPRDGAEEKPDRDEPAVTRRAERPVRTTRAEVSSATSAGLLTIEAPKSRPMSVEPAQAARSTAPTIAGALTTTAVEPATPTPPKPLSPIARVLELPGRIVNAVLQFLDFTSAATGPRSPFNIAPINDLLFAAFRELERFAGLYRTPAVQPVLPTMIYTGPTDRPTPTVAQFLNAATAGYGLGTLPGGLVPLTADGFQMSSTNIFSGMSGKAWVTPEGQVIIAYQGTTGGTNLLFNPLITISQVLADMQVILTRTTPLAFYDALRFARRVQDEAALQGYAADDVFVTGHSLGGWEAEFVAQRTGLAGIGFESPGINTTVPGNGADSMFVNIANYGSPVAFMATDLPALQPFMPPYLPGGGSKPHFGPIVLIGDAEAMNPMRNAAALFGKSLIGNVVFLVDFLGNLLQYHLPGVQAYHLDVDPNPGVVPWLGTPRGTVLTGYGELTIQQLMKAASDDGILIAP
jgi:hypothetical protein